MTAKAGGKLEILLYEMIGMDFWTGEGTTAKAFAEDLKAAGDAIREIHLRVNSPGGNVFDGIAIFNTLLSHGAKVTAQVDGLAASIASVIVMAASEISMGDNAMMMIHNPATMVGGDSNAMRKMADTMDKVKTSMITAYRRHTKLSVDEVDALMDEETWMTAQETVEKGFAETVTTPEGDAADVAANFDLSKFRRVPRQIAAVFGRSRPDPLAQQRRILARHETELDQMRRNTLAIHALQIGNMMRAAAIPEDPDQRRRRVLRERDRELRAWGVGEFVRESYYSDGYLRTHLVEAIDRSDERRRILAARDRELAGPPPPGFNVRIRS